MESPHVIQFHHHVSINAGTSTHIMQALVDRKQNVNYVESTWTVSTNVKKITQKPIVLSVNANKNIKSKKVQILHHITQTYAKHVNTHLMHIFLTEISFGLELHMQTRE